MQGSESRHPGGGTCRFSLEEGPRFRPDRTAAPVSPTRGVDRGRWIDCERRDFLGGRGSASNARHRCLVVLISCVPLSPSYSQTNAGPDRYLDHSGSPGNGVIRWHPVCSSDGWPLAQLRTSNAEERQQPPDRFVPTRSRNRAYRQSRLTAAKLESGSR